MTSLFRLIYTSRIAPAAEADLAPVVRQILETSQRNNAAEKLTGMLVVYRGRFLQVLEGPETAVDQRFIAIRHDRRHSDFRVPCWEAAAERAFPRWTMCAQDLSATDQAILEALDYKDNFDPDAWPPHTFLRLFTAVEAIHARALEDCAQNARHWLPA